MAWQVSGKSMELCSCNAWCPCWLGPDEPADQGWCRGIFGFDVESGNSDGVDLSGTKVVFMAHWPGNFFAGEGNARLFIDDSASAEQQRELEGIFSGQKGGLVEGLFGAVISTWHPAELKSINIDWGDNATISVDGIGQVSATAFGNSAGDQVNVSGSAVQEAFQLEGVVLANGRESNWSDPDIGDWRGNSCTLHSFDWAA